MKEGARAISYRFVFKTKKPSTNGSRSVSFRQAKSSLHFTWSLCSAANNECYVVIFLSPRVQQGFYHFIGVFLHASTGKFEQIFFSKLSFFPAVSIFMWFYHFSMWVLRQTKWMPIQMVKRKRTDDHISWIFGAKQRSSSKWICINDISIVGCLISMNMGCI